MDAKERAVFEQLAELCGVPLRELLKVDRWKRAVYALPPDHPCWDMTPHELRQFLAQLAALVRAEAAEKSAADRRSANMELYRSIHDLHRKGFTQKQIAAKVGKSIATVSRALKRPRP